jgi:hypothetical protein
VSGEDILLSVAIVSFGAWVLAVALLAKGRRLEPGQALALLFVVGMVGVVGMLIRSLAPEPLVLVLVGMVRAVFLIVPVAIVWEWISEQHPL